MTDETEALHRITVTVEGLGITSGFEFQISDRSLRSLVTVRGILDLSLRDKTNEILDKWLDEAAEHVESFRSGGFRYPITPREATE